MNSYSVERLFFKSGQRAGQPNGQYLVSALGQEPVKLPSVTTIIGAGLPKPQLIQWALATGVEAMAGAIRLRLAAGEALTPEELEVLEQTAKAEPDRFRDEAADIGTQVHDAIEKWLKTGREPVITHELVANGWRHFRAFWDQGGFEPVPPGLEFAVASLEHRFAGTVDCLAVNAEFELVLLDWKTSKGIYDSHELQAVAYAQAIEEMGIGRPDRIIIARFGKTDATFEARELEPRLWDGHFEQFLRCHDTHAWMSECTARYHGRKREQVPA